MVAFASGGRRRSEIAGLRKDQFTVEPPITVKSGPSLPSLAIHLGRTKTSGTDHDEVVYLTGRPVNAFCAAALRHGPYLHPRHNMFLCAAHQPEDIDRALEAVDKAMRDLPAMSHV
jgi:glutamate-1-semialdehyde aminotransferase